MVPDDDLTGLSDSPEATATAPRRRAPKRRGHRTQVTVPAEQWAEISDLADQLGTTANDALVRLASAALTQVAERRALQRLAAERRAAMASASGGGAAADFDYAEYEKAALAMRDEDER